MVVLDRRSVLAGSSALLAGCSRPVSAVSGIVGGSPPLPIPRLLDAGEHGDAISLTVQSGETVFYPGRSSPTLGYNGGYLGPTLRVHRGQDVKVAVENRLPADTTVHWHGLLIPGELDGGPHQVISSGATWRPVLPIRQPAATLFYHSHAHGLTAEQVYSGLAGVLLVTDPEEQGLGLPSDYGVDDLPLVIQDRHFRDGRLILPQGMMVGMQGRRGDTILVNGAPSPIARVPDRLVRLRLVNGSNARIYQLAFSDGRSFHWIGTEGGLLERSVELQALSLASGQRAEILVDFANGRPAKLISAPDPNASMGGMGMGMGGGVADGGGMLAVMTFEPVRSTRARGSAMAPQLLTSRAKPDVTKVVRRRQLVLNMGMGGMMGGGSAALSINGKAFDMNRIDEQVRLGDVEIWEVSAETMRHPIHIHGVHFDVLSRGGAKPDVLDQGARDTVLVKEPVELLIRFDQPTMTAPFMYHCHTLEHEDNGMMGQFSVA
jgi:blue copper oxidase